MRLECHPSLVEEAVFLKARGARESEREFHRELDPLYKHPEGRDRDIAFAEAHGRLFTRWGLDGVIERLLAERPALSTRVPRCVAGPCDPASTKAELFARPGRKGDDPSVRTLVMHLPAAALLDPLDAQFPLRRDLLRIHDMLDPAFGFKPAEFRGPLAHQNLQRDRLAVAWEIWIVSRLHGEGRAEGADLERLKPALARALSLDPSGVEIAQTLARIGGGELASWEPLCAWAESPWHLGGRTAASRKGARKGSVCPICGFPTCDWFDFDGEAEEAVADQVAAFIPHWPRQEGACRQCVELLTARAAEHAAASGGGPSMGIG